MARYGADHHDQTHAAILDAAADLLRERGFDGVSVGAVMKAVGLTHGGFYAHFPDKAELLKAAMEQALVPTVDRFDRWTAAAQAAGDPTEVARTYLSDHHVAHPGEGCAAAALTSEIGRQSVEVRAVFAKGAEAAAVLLARLYPGEAAWGVFAMMFGALALMRAVPDEAQRTAIRARVFEDLLTLAAADRTAGIAGSPEQAPDHS
jgi:TetR/AcrR family transcriptional repressor of nem operon